MASVALAFDLLARRDTLTPALKDAGQAADNTGGRISKLGGAAKVGLLAVGAAAIGAAAGMTSLVGEARESAKIGRLTEAVLKSTGGAANTTAQQVSDLATALSNKSAVDDELIQSGANVLLTFTRVRNEAGAGNDVFNKGAEAALNMSTALGTDLQGATLQVGKALNDPLKGITSLTRAGIQFTEQQKEQIAALVESGDTLGAQKIILGELETQFGGAAAAAADPLERLKVVAGNLGEEVGTLLLPTIERFATFVSDEVLPRVSSLIEGFEDGTGAGGRLRDGFNDVRDGAVAAFDYFKTDVLPRLVEFRDFVRDEVVPRVADFAGYIRDDLVPQLKDLRDRFNEDVMPRLREVADYLAETFTPTWDALVDLYEEKLKPAIDKIKDALEENAPALEKIRDFTAKVAAVVFLLYTQYLSYLYPILVKVAGYLVDTLVVAFTTTLDTITLVVGIVEDLRDRFDTAKTKVGNFIEAMKDIKIPEPLEKIAEILERIGSAAGGAAGRARDFVEDRLGDIAGSFRGTSIGGGGAALARVQSVLPAGLSITSTYRSPAHNARVGGSPTSLHMDRDNPAVDIAGSTSALDAFAQTLAAMGGWRQLLWRVKGHFDHIHVADQGGVFQGPGLVYMGAGQETFASGLQGARKIADLPKGGGSTDRMHRDDIALLAEAIADAVQTRPNVIDGEVLTRRVTEHQRRQVSRGVKP